MYKLKSTKQEFQLRNLLIWFWALLVFSADLKLSLHPQIHWIVTFILLVPVLLLEFKMHDRIELKNLVFPALFIISILISGFSSDDPLYSLIQSAKLVVILLIAHLFFITKSKYAHIAFKASIASVYINLCFILLGMFFSLNISQIMTGDGRWGNILNYPGSLAKVGIIPFVYALYGSIVIRPLSFKHIFLLIVSVCVVYFDGSRTGGSILIIASLYTILILLLENNLWGFIKKYPFFNYFSILFITLFFYVILIGQVSLFDSTDTRLQNTLNAIFNNGLLAGLAESDYYRYNMLLTSLNQIQNHPFFGSGIGSTRFDSIVIHNTYLQSWADLGLMGFISYILIVTSWIFMLFMSYQKIKMIGDPNKRGIYYCSIFILFYFIYNGLFHPLSTEWSEWIIFIIFVSIFYEIKRSKTISKKEGLSR